MTIQDSPVVAGKIVPKSLLVKQHQREKMAQEISLHKTLNHPYIVKLYSYFEDKVSSTKRNFHIRQKTVTEKETK